MSYVWPDRRNRERPKGTYELNVYVVPEDPKVVDPDVARRWVELLRADRIVGCCYDQGLGWLAPGERSCDLFEESTEGAPAFEYLIPYGSPISQFVPNAHTGRFGACCGRCGADLDEALHDFIQEGEADAASHELHCTCGERTRVSELECEIATSVTPVYLNFCHVSGGELRLGERSRIEAILGGPIRVVRERL